MEISKRDFFIEYLWAVYCAGFRVSVIEKHWPALRKAYFDFDTSKIQERSWISRREALKIINNQRKTEAILRTVNLLVNFTPLRWLEFMSKASKNIDEFKFFPYIGDTLKYQLARALGFDTIKPDVHIKRLADRFELDPFEMCEIIKKETGYSLHLIDTIFWRAAEQKSL